MTERKGHWMRVLGLVAATWVVGMAGCGGSEAGGGGGAAGGGGGAAGGDGVDPAETHKCDHGMISTGISTNPYVVEAVTGDNGTFVDHCDENGNLVQYNCEFTICDGVNCEPIFTGVVVEDVFDCKGPCKAGVCERGCPEADVALTIASVDATGTTTLNDAASGTGYTCTSVIDMNSNDGWACTGAEAVGATGKVGNSSGSCNRGEGAFRVGFPTGDCFYLNCAHSN
ncbi:hypothetical protein [Polyangium mundeleinium]|uniref:4Fe-4S ferredoxin-type domain-containing protein n=1 Tax=Polyangium mundeleinium TaxID=2995306 RepID=A0ABT5EV65_9BACT|nr:hypothetical protein [Polyangium mundeleinium]MDC0745329.1 hypothetical protein [Polyangium mundeleinium]